MNFFAILNNRRGTRYLDEMGDLDRAATAFERAIRHADNWSAPWYNLGLVRKRRRQWPESLACNLQAAELNPSDEAAWWNAGIAATALGEWETARHAWSSVGITLPPGAGEVRLPLGLTPIRLNPHGNSEVVWCQRIDPARAIIQNVPLPTSGYRHGDLLLHDGAPTGMRRWRDQEIPVFDALQRLRVSSYATYAVRVRAASEAAIIALAELAEDRGLGIEDGRRFGSCAPPAATGRPTRTRPQRPAWRGRRSSSRSRHGAMLRCTRCWQPGAPRTQPAILLR